ncbi:MAG TPA: PEP-CTERM sorting domain-containing protein [Tepidisphaeraceae bacterium]|nr:PEP-CTERM sorting domain-containing protein [Tepidisphaeraceae bacterium]
MRKSHVAPFLLTSALICPLVQAGPAGNGPGSYQVWSSVAGWNQAIYNYGTYGPNYTPIIGSYTSIGGVANGTPNTVGVIPGDTNGLATSVLTETAGSTNYLGHNGSYDIVSASANLATGTIAFNSYDTGTDNGYQGYDGGGTNVGFADQLTFTVPGASPTKTTLVPFMVTETGTSYVTGSDVVGDASSGVDLVFGAVGNGISETFGNAIYNNDDSPHTNAQSFVNSDNINTTYETLLDNSPYDFVVAGTFPVTGPSETVQFFLEFTGVTRSVDGMYTHYQATLSIGSLPGDASYSSASGVFDTAVPEPTSSALLAMAGLLAFRRQRKTEIVR